MKYPARTSWITYEGMSYVSVLAFIVLGSIMRQINLLVLLSGLMIAPFFFNWRIAFKMVERTRANRRLPDWVHAGRSFTVGWLISNERRRLPGWALRVVDRIKVPSADLDKRQIEKVQVVVPPIRPGEQLEVNYRCLAPTRGRLEFGPAELSSAFPFGLYRTKIKITAPEVIVVAPRLGKLTEKWRQMTASIEAGADSKQRRRSSQDDEFFGVRDWQNGDNVRHIHWRSSAKRGELVVRQFEQMTAQYWCFILDPFRDELVRSEDFELALSFFATLACNAARDQNSRLTTLGIVGSEAIYQGDRRQTGQLMMQLADQSSIADGSVEFLVSELKRINVSSKANVAVISTRSLPADVSKEVKINNWIDVTNGQASQFFVSNESDVSEFLRAADLAANQASNHATVTDVSVEAVK